MKTIHVLILAVAIFVGLYSIGEAGRRATPNHALVTEQSVMKNLDGKFSELPKKDRFYLTVCYTLAKQYNPSLTKKQFWNQVQQIWADL